MKKLIKYFLSIFLAVVAQKSLAQTKDFTEKFTTGKYTPNKNADSYLGIWQSINGNYTITLDKEVEEFKNENINFKTDMLIFKLTNVKLKDEKSEKFLNKPISLNIAVGHANTIYQDPVTNNSVDLYIYFRNKDTIELVVTTNLTGDRSKGSYFPERMMFKRVVK